MKKISIIAHEGCNFLVLPSPDSFQCGDIIEVINSDFGACIELSWKYDYEDEEDTRYFDVQKEYFQLTVIENKDIEGSMIWVLIQS